MAVQEVLTLPELLECILLNLPIRDLLFSQKVCRRWKAAVDSSPIQKALFFRPGTAANINYISSNHISTTAWLEASAKNTPDGDEYKSAQHCLEHMATIRREGYAINPLLITYGSGQPFHLKPELWQQRDAVNSTLYVPSWTRMFLTQPPGITHVRKSMERVYEVPKSPGRLAASECVSIDVSTGPGDTFGVLVERCHREAEEFIMRRSKGKWRVRESRSNGDVVELVSAYVRQRGGSEKRD
ncbi:hypothetical protein LTR56_021815 [Elasticomyces elasticus]|nr:hypothetical protein LTR56_021815 [Elasticomyces elasticus]KAK3650860.1 hypothetical protein LTR22_012336 [Elasticomyces elasticus]KAK4906999.1 hypothetical protein LTR49_023920 [Elasticomyces elasticus]KAK5742432.1 hypothetical protein LTS12_024248 [Elasticomyces elasticus]